MAFDLGDVVPLTVDIKDSNGAAANAGAVTLTITLPDGTTSAPSVSNPSTGRYQVDYATVQAGRHIVRWVATGANASAYTDAFDVAEATPPLILSLRDGKKQLNLPLTSTTHDEELRDFIAAVTDAVEFFTGPVVVRTYSERIEGDRPVLALSHTPVVSVTSIVPILTGGTTYDVADADVDADTGVVQLVDGTWFKGPLRATYKSGRRVMPGSVGIASRIILQHLWRTQRGPVSTVRARGASADDDTTYVPGLGYAIPNRALELLQRYRLAPEVG
ncbi:hypothetical protein C8D88_116141 [Lentzea atacamensis]|uniref:Ig-like domain (Group 3) n=1 Tax=Lentzea atacamensis TaxID=531938 RepID=A0A316I2T5_9PSEU|nr:hypothetical protein [Lentzea atacamensis]PWK81729.1 hypothetical protein C8D88_116141 [Lentzea atacamensis]